MGPLRKCRIRQLLNTITSTDETDGASNSSIKIAKDVLRNLKELDLENDPDRIKHVDETFMDARIYNTASNVAYNCISNVDYTKNNFDGNDMADKLIDTLTDGKPDDFTLDNMYSFVDLVALDMLLPTIASYSSLFGALSTKPTPQPKARKPIAKDQVKAVKKQLHKVNDIENSTSSKTDDILKFHLKVLNDAFKKNERTPVDYYEFVIDTDDFGRTVENIFYTSFIINDGKVKLSLGSDGIATLEPVDKKSRINVKQEDGGNKFQLVTSIDMELWRLYQSQFKAGILQKYRLQNSS